MVVNKTLYRDADKYTTNSIPMFDRVVRSFDKKGASFYLTGLFIILEESSIFMFEKAVQSFEKNLHLQLWQYYSAF